MLRHYCLFHDETLSGNEADNNGFPRRASVEGFIFVALMQKCVSRYKCWNTHAGQRDIIIQSAKGSVYHTGQTIWIMVYVILQRDSIIYRGWGGGGICFGFLKNRFI